MIRLLPPVLGLLLLTACGLPPDEHLDPQGNLAPVLEGTVDLGAECLNIGDVLIHGGRAYASCAGPFGAGAGQVAVIELGSGSVQLVETGGAPGVLAAGDDLVYVADQAEGQLFVLTTDGTLLHGADDPVVLCPSDFAAGVYQFVAGLAVTRTGAVLATCFSSDEVIRFRLEAGAEGDGGVRNATVTGRATVGDGPGAVALWGENRAVVLDGLGGTVSVLTLGADLSTSVAAHTAGEAPNDVVVRGDRAILVNASSNTVQVIDLVLGATVAEVPTGDGTNPWALDMVDDDTAVVSLQVSDEVAVVDLAAGTVTRAAMPTGDDLLPLEGAEPKAGPQGVAIADDGSVLVSLTNLGADWSPAGHGMLARVRLEEVPEAAEQ